MPGLVGEVVQSFRTPRQYYTIQAVKEDTKSGTGIIASALLHNLFDRLEVIERRMAAREEGPQIMRRSA